MSLASMLVAVALAASPSPEKAVDAAAGPGLSSRSVCAARFDPEFVRFVPPAPSSARNPLLRLIAAPDDSAFAPGAGASCKRMLTRYETGR